MPCCGPRNSEATMTLNDYLQLGLYLAIILAATPLLGRYLTGLFNGEARWLRPIERPLYALAGVDPDREQRSEEQTSELQSLMRNSYAVFCLQKKNMITS